MARISWIFQEIFVRAAWAVPHRRMDGELGWKGKRLKRLLPAAFAGCRGIDIL